MYWTPTSRDAPRCLFPEADGGEYVVPEALCGERGPHACPDTATYNLEALCHTHDSLLDAISDPDICTVCSAAAISRHNLA